MAPAWEWYGLAVLTRHCHIAVMLELYIVNLMRLKGELQGCYIMQWPAIR
uniref:Uncharacterized protein n=1 Tax=Onchocerca volvulus TaxID=6282 RepID=A0A2K6W825_ONCVO